MLTRIAVLVSGGGTNLQALLDAQREGKLPHGEIVLVVSNKAGVYALERAAQAGIPARALSPKELGGQQAFENALLALLKEYQVDMIVLAGFLAILSSEFVRNYENRILNIHPSLIPSFCGKGMYGLKVHQAALDYGVKVTGATVFRIVRAMDAGPILAQSTVEIGAHETAGELLNRLAEDGSRLLAASLQAMADDQIAPVEQPAGAYEVAQKITVEDAHIRFDIPVFAVDRQIRACTPNPGAWCELHANAEAEPATLHVLRAQGADMSNPNTPVSLEPGRIVAGKKNVWVGTSSDPLELLEVKAQGKKAMRAADWARGAHLDGAYCK